MEQNAFDQANKRSRLDHSVHTEQWPSGTKAVFRETPQVYLASRSASMLRKRRPKPWLTNTLICRRQSAAGPLRKRTNDETILTCAVDRDDSLTYSQRSDIGEGTGNVDVDHHPTAASGDNRGDFGKPAEKP